jgi:hypothetical protein
VYVTFDPVEDLLVEYQQLVNRDGDAELEAIKVAILLEELFGVTLTDEDLTGDLLDGPEAMRAVLRRRQGAH